MLTNANGLGGTPEWIQLLPSGTPPFSNVMESVVYDSLTNRLIVYGGCYENCGFALYNVFVLTNANGLDGPPVWSESTVTNPQGRTYHTGVYDSNSNSLITFGGQLAYFGTDQNDTRVLSNGNGVTSPSIWSTLSPAGDPPPIRNYHTAIYDEVNNRMTVFAGSNYIQHCWWCNPGYYVISDYNDVWVLSDANGVGAPTWTQLSPDGSLPSPRGVHSAVYDPVNNRMLVFGGLSWDQTTQTHTSLDDLWQLSYANGLDGTPTWTQITPSGTPPGLTPGLSFNHSAAFDTVHQRMIVSGGRSQITDVATNRVWVLIDNNPPVARCANRTVPADSNCQADASVDDGSFDPDGDDITLVQSPAGPYSLGSHPVTLTVTDDGGNSASCQATVTVVDNTPPTVTCPTVPRVECSGPTGATVLFTATGSDNCASVTPHCSPLAGVFPLGQTPVTCTAADGAGNQASCGFTVQVVDPTPPTIQSVNATPATLWPPNHQMVPVSVTVNSTDLCDSQPACKITSVSSNEPDNGLGDGDTANDIDVRGDLSVKLRAERSGKGNGRIYTINVQCDDDAGNTATGATTVTVPHSQGKK